ncbi:uncharacterized protein BJX67DRAFT_148796 [Aspergillus lucknowensis]|uniref:Zn(2)-C6 fungal-type domain-containing protein n=1 Tax=Aspergillus lucknowensis TaxID=176173 RepID=A0ABR4LNR2_9EURO
MFKPSARSCEHCRRRRRRCPRDGPPCSACRLSRQKCVYPQFFKWTPEYQHQSGNNISTPNKAGRKTSCAIMGRTNLGQGSQIFSSWERVFPIDFAHANLAMKGSVVSLVTAVLGRIHQSDSLRYISKCAYGRTLSLLNTAIATEPRANSTMRAVYVLAINDMVTCGSLEDMQRSLIHFDTVVALMRQRNGEEIRDKEDLTLIVRLKFCIISQSSLLGQRVADYVMEPLQITSSLQHEPDTYCDRLICIIGRLSHLQTDINEKKVQESAMIKLEALSILVELLEWNETLPPGSFYSDQNHIYHDMWACHAINQYRCARIRVYEILSTNCASDSFRAEFQKPAFDICSSVRFHFSKEAIKNPEFVCFDWYPLRGLNILWPLFLAARTESRTRTWVKGCLQIIGERMGIGQSLALLSVLECEENVSKAPVVKYPTPRNAVVETTLIPPSSTEGNPNEETGLKTNVATDSALDYDKRYEGDLSKHAVTLHNCQLVQDKEQQLNTITGDLYRCFENLGGKISTRDIYDWFVQNTGRERRSSGWWNTVQGTLSHKSEFIHGPRGYWSMISVGGSTRI